MENEKFFALNEIENNKKIFIDVSDKIWEYAELSLQEYKSTELYCSILLDLGFKVERNLVGISTAFSGTYGSGAPYIGVLGEFDALSGLSQEGGATDKKPLIEGGNGHGCGHNMLGAGALAAAYGIKKYLEKTGKCGTVIFYGTPGEEGGAGKAFMAKDGLWRKMDVCLTWHPSDVNQVSTGSCNSCLQTLYKFNGISAHASGDPQDGRSALDAVELMNVGVQYLREHTKPDARIHYAMIDGGGFSPNVVQSTASVLYMVRSELVKDALTLQNRVDNIAKGAALMTGTTFEKIFIDGCSNTVYNTALEKLAYKNFKQVGVSKYTKEEIDFANKIRSTYNREDLPQVISATKSEEAKKDVIKLSNEGKKSLNDFLSPFYSGNYFEPGSTDVGDVTWQTPTVQINTVTFPSGSPGHSWQNVSLGKTTIGYKGLINAGKVLASIGIDIINEPSLLTEIKDEFLVRTANGYVCPIPKDEKAKIVKL